MELKVARSSVRSSIKQEADMAGQSTRSAAPATRTRLAGEDPHVGAAVLEGEAVGMGLLVAEATRGLLLALQDAHLLEVLRDTVSLENFCLKDARTM